MTKRIAAFFDGPNFHSACRAIGRDADFKRILGILRKEGDLVRAAYYTAVPKLADGEFVSLQPLLDWLAYNGFIVITREMKSFTQENGETRRKGNLDCEIIVDMMEIAPRVDEIWLFSGDGDFAYAVAAVQRKGVRVVAVSVSTAGIVTQSNPLASDTLRRQVDEFKEAALIEGIWRERPAAVVANG